MENVSSISPEQDFSCSFADLLKCPRHAQEPQKLEPKRTIIRWTEEEKTQLTALFQQGTNVDEIASQLNRSVDGVIGQIRKLGLRRCKTLTLEQEQVLKHDFWLLGVDGCAKKLKRNRSTVAYYAKLLNLKKPTLDEFNPPIPRTLLPYDMVKRVSILQRKSPTSRNQVEDAVVIFYDKNGPSTPMMAMHLDELCLALDNHFKRRRGVTAAALIHGYKQA
ncbi:GcrA family cell cycle regulator [Vibrio cholerae]|uniref:GcrA family cell cycle regulator n=1 Tax=Vibrio TaxID=662 RepID=UPI0002734B35|nr:MULTISPECIES: GcrA family cell cycle regulator [Vibrio]EGR0667188.1 gcrA cell cycle regulator family protein [Vibrio cholerae]EJH52749.1 hypothetical protein VCHC43B1_1565 [Vibrio cholerae HC-43B1]EKL00816.1 gcrA cell cycle regulator family protein [Vibrio cholerae HC-41B1]EKL96506.1 gcrA cell cycle regulator family protein [Vibrio cholerae HC-46B1]EKL96553.1 gcrA cell cycle regulator family protein [Vibrio cholerae HC-46B1]